MVFTFDIMLVAIVGSLILAGLLCFWVSLLSLARLDRKPVAGPVQQSKGEDPKLTRLGRPVEEVKVQG